MSTLNKQHPKGNGYTSFTPVSSNIDFYPTQEFAIHFYFSFLSAYSLLETVIYWKLILHVAKYEQCGVDKTLADSAESTASSHGLCPGWKYKHFFKSEFLFLCFCYLTLYIIIRFATCADMHTFFPLCGTRGKKSKRLGTELIFLLTNPRCVYLSFLFTYNNPFYILYIIHLISILILGQHTGGILKLTFCYSSENRLSISKKTLSVCLFLSLQWFPFCLWFNIHPHMGTFAFKISSLLLTSCTWLFICGFIPC